MLRLARLHAHLESDSELQQEQHPTALDGSWLGKPSQLSAAALAAGTAAGASDVLGNRGYVIFGMESGTFTRYYEIYTIF